MAREEPHTSDRERRLGEILAEYLDASAAGRAPRRAELLAAHPSFASELQVFLSDHDRLKERIAAIPQLDVDALYDDFRRATGADEPDRFLVHLCRSGIIDEQALHFVLRSTEVETTNHASGTMDATIECGQDTGTEQAPALDRDRYELVDDLGAGGMGVVYLAKDRSLLREVAYKQMRSKTAQDPELKHRFLREVQVTALLEHPNIVPVYTVERTAEGLVGYTMKVVRGKTLREIIRETRTFYEQGGTPDEEHSLLSRLDCFLKVCEAVAYAHDKGVLHRDLKPENIMIGSFGEVYVMDWGLHRLIGAGEETDSAGSTADVSAPLPTDATRSGSALGTPRYMSPEQAEGRHAELDARSDLYALGLILFELVTLKRGIPGESFRAVWDRAMKGETEDPEHAFAHVAVPVELKAIIETATATAPEDRYATVSHLADDVRRYLHNEEIAALPDNALRSLLRRMSRHRVATLITMIVLIVLAAAATIAGLLHAQSTLAEARHREQRLHLFLDAVARQSHAIDRELNHYQRQLENLRGHAVEILTRVSPPHADFYVDVDSERPGEPARRPPDLAPSAYFGMPVSVDWPVFKLAPGVVLEETQDDVRRLTLLQPTFKQMLLRSREERLRQYADTAIRRILATDGCPILWAYVSLESGVHCGYPGKFGYGADYDPRTRPFYAAVVGERGLRWGAPYYDKTTRHRVLACSAPLYDDQGEFLGVAGFDLTLDFIVERLLEMPEIAYAQRYFLVNESGQVVVDSVGNLTPGAPEELEKNEPLELETLPFPKVLDALRARQTGYVDLEQPHRVFAFFPVHTLGWRYVVLADGDAMFAHDSG